MINLGGLTGYYMEASLDAENPIQTVNVTLTEPKNGAKPDTAISTSTEGVAVSATRIATTANTCRWYHGTTTQMSDSDTFIAGETYSAKFMIRATSGHELAATPTVYVNGKEATYKSTTGTSLTYEIIYTLPEIKPIDTVNLTVTEPKVGAKVDGTTKTTTEGIEVSAFITVNGTSSSMKDHLIWYDSTSQLTVLDEGTDKFEAGRKYTATAFFTALDGYQITKDTKVYLNGKLMTTNVLTAIFGYDGAVAYDLEFTATEKDTRKKGDLNNNGKIDASDLLKVKSHIKKVKDPGG